MLAILFCIIDLVSWDKNQLYIKLELALAGFVLFCLTIPIVRMHQNGFFNAWHIFFYPLGLLSFYGSVFFYKKRKKLKEDEAKENAEYEYAFKRLGILSMDEFERRDSFSDSLGSSEEEIIRNGVYIMENYSKDLT
ncbi:MAG: hypothetical protein LBL47_02810 [Lactobacillus sp.]|nr:hypothetical protein [Lactobacillus sp.]